MSAKLQNRRAVSGLLIALLLWCVVGFVVQQRGTPLPVWAWGAAGLCIGSMAGRLGRGRGHAA